MDKPGALEFVVPMVPYPKQSVKSGNGQWYKPRKLELAERTFCAFANKFAPVRPLQGAIKLTVVCRWPFRVRERKSDAEFLKETNPDWDNLGKFVGDCLEMCGFFENDGQVADGRVIKLWSRQPSITVRLAKL